MKRLSPVAMAVLLTWPALGSPPPAPVQSQHITLGDAQVQAGQPVKLTLPAGSFERLESAMRGLMPQPGSADASVVTSLPRLRLVWSSPGRQPETFVVAGDALSLPVAADLSATYFYHLEARPPEGLLFLRVPAPGLEFRIDAVLAGGPAVLEAPGDQEGVFGETIPLRIRLADPSAVGQVELHHRLAQSSGWSMTPMELSEGTQNNGIWTANLVRPLGEHPFIEYYITARNLAGRATEIGTVEKPHRIVVQKPEVPPGLEP
ncbi:MAG: hypothetical protein HY816_07970 [Candidatus Wallbacteria bacterium]|nr:hypothetical protein [Candidatus Wallbacteria bacterium]